MILTTNDTGMRYALAATAWRHVLGCRDAGPAAYDAIRAFRDANRDRGPERVP